MIYKNKNSVVLYDNDISLCIREYYNYIFSLIEKIINDINLPINIILGNQQYNFDNLFEFKNNKTIKIGINYEHTLVKKGGRDSFNAPVGNTKDDDGDNYLVRIDNYSENILNDIIIDYSIPNIINIRESNLFTEYSKKTIYIAPMLYEKQWGIKKREINCLTTFINTNEARRQKLLIEIQNKNIQHININNCFESKELEKLYLNTKILLNVHQTEHHHTFEELRVLPALLCGILVICEESPLKEKIPYHEYIIWTNYDNIINKTIEVSENYHFYYNKIFENNDTISILNYINYNNIKNKLLTYNMDSLDTISKKYALDKNICSGCHNYIPGYSGLFDKIRKNIKNVLEIGIGSVENGQMGGILNLGYRTGNSLKCWSEYFFNAKIYGIDIFAHPELNNGRIHTMVSDQSNTQELKNVVEYINEEIDIIIDDGSHNGEHQKISFMFLEKYLSKEGIYVIEDIQPDYIEKYNNLSIFPEEFKNYILQKYEVKIFDTRYSENRYRADDFMMAFIRR